MDYNAWMAWAQVAGIHSTVIAFLKLAGDFSGSSSDRWEKVSAILQSTPTISDTNLLSVLQAVMGEPASSSFLAYKKAHPGGLFGF